MKDKEIFSVFEPGTSVSIGGSIHATVQQVCIEHSRKIQYQVAWWDGNTRKKELLHESEVGPMNSTRNEMIGFAK